MVKRLLDVTSIFGFNFKFSQRYCNLHCFACNSQILQAILQLELWSRQIYFLFAFLEFFFFFWNILRHKGLSLVTTGTCMQTLMLHIFKRLLSPSCFGSERYQIPVFSYAKGDHSTAYKIGKNRQNKKVFHTVIKYLFQLAKGLWLPLEQLQKILKLPLEHIACKVQELHTMPTMFAIYRWENLI